MKREKKLTKRERKAAKPRPDAPSGDHIHCIACGRHIDPAEFDDPATAKVIVCQHRSSFPSCIACEPTAKRLIDEHDRTGQAVRSASAWH